MTSITCTPRPAYAHRYRAEWPPSLLIIHATRGHTTLDLQDQATVNWFTGGAPDQGGWSPTADALVSADEDRCWVFERSIADLRTYHSAFSAGYGAQGTRWEYSADEHAISIEVAQTPAQEPYSDATLRRLVALVRTIETTLGFKVPRQRVPYWSQLRSDPVPRGFIGHEDTANGRKAGKSDPGAQFPWGEFLWLLNEDVFREEVDVEVVKLATADALPAVLAALGGLAGAVGQQDGQYVGVAAAPPGYRDIVIRVKG